MFPGPFTIANEAYKTARGVYEDAFVFAHQHLQQKAVFQIEGKRLDDVEIFIGGLESQLNACVYPGIRDTANLLTLVPEGFELESWGHLRSTLDFALMYGEVTSEFIPVLGKLRESLESTEFAHLENRKASVLESIQALEKGIVGELKRIDGEYESINSKKISTAFHYLELMTSTLRSEIKGCANVVDDRQGASQMALNLKHSLKVLSGAERFTVLGNVEVPISPMNSVDYARGRANRAMNRKLEKKLPKVSTPSMRKDVEKKLDQLTYELNVCKKQLSEFAIKTLNQLLLNFRELSVRVGQSSKTLNDVLQGLDQNHIITLNNELSVMKAIIDSIRVEKSMVDNLASGSGQLPVVRIGHQHFVPHHEYSKGYNQVKRAIDKMFETVLAAYSKLVCDLDGQVENLEGNTEIVDTVVRADEVAVRLKKEFSHLKITLRFVYGDLLPENIVGKLIGLSLNDIERRVESLRASS